MSFGDGLEAITPTRRSAATSPLKGEVEASRRGGASAQLQFHHRQIQPAAELLADLVVGADEAEA